MLLHIGIEQEGQRIDNFLIKRLKDLPKVRIYRALRKGEIRVNSGRIKPDYRLRDKDCIRIPPWYKDSQDAGAALWRGGLGAGLEQRILYEDDGLLIINKPAGMPVHGGSKVRSGVIECLRGLRPNAHFLELVHRLDRDTSGCLAIAKKRRNLLEWHRLLIEKKVRKQYLALVMGRWEGGERKVETHLVKRSIASNEWRIKVEAEGKLATTLFRPLRQYSNAALVEAFPISGRTHQIRVHAAYIGHPVAGDSKYGDETFNEQIRHCGLKRLFLHAVSLSYRFPNEQPWTGIGCSLDQELQKCLENLT